MLWDQTIVRSRWLLNKEKCVKSRKIVLCLIVGLVITIISSRVLADNLIKDEKFVKDDVTFVLRGQGVKRAFFQKVFDVKLFLSENDHPKNILDDVSKYLSVRYSISVPAKRLRNYTIHWMRENATKMEYRRIAPSIEKMKGYFVDLHPGDEFVLMYIAGKGTSFICNGKVYGVIEGAEFARILFAVWVGKVPFDPNLKRDLLRVKH